MTTIYTKPQLDAIAVKLGNKIKEAKTAVTQEQGQSTTQAVSQKLFTDTTDDINLTIDSINAKQDSHISLKTDENNHIIGQGKEESETVYDLSLRSDKVRVSAPTDVEFGDLVFKTYEKPTDVNGVTVPKGTFLNPALVLPLLGTAASRLVGVDAGNVLEMGARGIANSGLVSRLTSTLSVNEANIPSLAKPSGFYKNASAASGDMSVAIRSSIVLQAPYTDNSNNPFAVQLIIPVASPYGLFIRRKDPLSDTYLTATELFYSNFNTTKDSNGFIKAASPIVKVFADKVELNYDAEKQDVTYIKNGIGDYTITTVSGLSTDGWYIELPKDMNGNPKVAVTLSEVDGVISLKTYKRIFSMETFTFEPDLDNPLDIPDTRWIDLRLNEIPVEIEDDIQTEV